MLLRALQPGFECEMGCFRGVCLGVMRCCIDGRGRLRCSCGIMSWLVVIDGESTSRIYIKDRVLPTR